LMDRRIKAWLAIVEGLVVDVGCGDRKAEALLSTHNRYIGVDYLPVTQVSPWRAGFPDVNADALRLPLRTESVDCVLNMSVLEHVTSPERLVREICRVVRPGGIAILGGPGDITMSHGEPYNFFNLTRFAYHMLLEKNGFVIEEEYYPARFWLSIVGLLYNYFVRNDFYNRGPVRKLLQAVMLGISLVISPVVNIVALGLDSLLPFDRRGYSYYMVRARKPSASPH
jgi:SAM-dependent methyltransferase